MHFILLTFSSILLSSDTPQFASQYLQLMLQNNMNNEGQVLLSFSMTERNLQTNYLKDDSPYNRLGLLSSVSREQTGECVLTTFSQIRILKIFQLQAPLQNPNILQDS